MIQPGTLIQNYKIVEHIGAGGMGEVYKVVDISPGKPGDVFLALKVLRVKSRDSFSEDNELRRCFKDNYERYRSQSLTQFKKEAELLFKLRHTSLPRLYKYFSDDDQNTHYIIMDYIEGDNLSSIANSIERGQFLDEERILRWAFQLLELLRYMHYGSEEKIIYRDLKPSNIIVDKDDKIKIVDFGISKIFNPDKVYISKTLTVLQGLGTFEYMPLEQYPEANKRILPQDIYLQVRITDERSDIYALGGTLYFLLTKVVPVPAFYRANNDFLTKPSEINPSIHPATEKVLLKALALLPKDRYQNIGEMKKDLECCFPRIRFEPNNASNLTFKSFRESLLTLKVNNENTGSFPLKAKVTTDIQGIRIKPDSFIGDSEINFYLDSTKIDPGFHSGKIFISSNMGNTYIPFSFDYSLKDPQMKAEMLKGEKIWEESRPTVVISGNKVTASPPQDKLSKEASPDIERPPGERELAQEIQKPAESGVRIPFRIIKTLVMGVIFFVILIGIGFFIHGIKKPGISHPTGSPSSSSTLITTPSNSLSPAATPNDDKDLLFAEVEKGDVAGVKKILESNNSLVNVKKDYTFKKKDGGDVADSFAPIHRAVLRNDIEMVDLLISKGANIHIRTKFRGVTALHIAAILNRLEIANLLVNKGADVNSESLQSLYTPLHNACDKGHKEMVRLLIDSGGNLNAQDDSNKTPLHNAVCNNYKEIVEILLNRGADVNARSKNGWTPLKYAIEQKNKEMQVLLKKYGGKQ